MEYVRVRAQGKPEVVVHGLAEMGYDAFLNRIGDPPRLSLRVELVRHLPVLMALLNHPNSTKLKPQAYSLLARLPVAPSILDSLQTRAFAEDSPALRFYLAEPLISQVEACRLPLQRYVDLITLLPKDFRTLIWF